MAAQEDVYATLLLSDTYLPGALVLAHSLRDAGTTKKLAALVTRDTVAPEVVTELETVYDYIIPVDTIRNTQTANLHLMNRADLHSAFTKINLWKQTQFRKIVYIDADVVAYRAPDELFDLPHAFSAAPDIGWPDLFNTGVMVLTPNLGDYHAMLAMAERSISFDGADQGLINMHFKNNHNRLSFAYNVTPSGHYQYVPAYRHFQSGISMVHFIGPEKPWFQGRRASSGSSPYDEMAGRWWAVYDRHYHGSTTTSELVQYFTKGEYHPNGATKNSYIQKHGQNGYQTSSSSWDAQRQSPPQNSRPEAANFPSTVYHMSQDTTPWVAPRWYQPPREPGAPPMKLIFPWESERTAPSRVFAEDFVQEEPEEEEEVEEEPEEEEEEEDEPLSSGAQTPTGQWNAPSVTNASTDDQGSELVTPTTPTHHVTPSTWSSFTLTNAWDDVPEIERYVDKIQKHKRGPSIKSIPAPMALQEAERPDVVHRRRGSKVTDFPSETERPSLPVTPAPISRPKFWDGNDDNPLLPAAQGVPAQSEWVCEHGTRWTPAACLCDITNILHAEKDPAAKLQELSEWHGALLQKLGGEGGGEDSGHVHSHAAQPATLVSPQPVKGGSAIHSLESNLETLPRIITTGNRRSGGVAPIPAPSYAGPGAVFEKGATPVPRATIARHPVATHSSGILEPSYSGPGPAFEKDENIPMELPVGQ
ncbi:glycosyltransferase family 8 protein [Daldinia sp. FL1419]|nr:glycosyltransferase family 8 protein [Daldinia sp. FL1419]